MLKQRISHLGEVRGCVPASFRDDATVEWRPLTAAALAFPFLRRGIEVTCAGDPPLESGLELLEELARAPEPMPEVAVIAHVSRCGSTVVSECLRELGDVAVLSEPQIMSKLLRHFDAPVVRAVIARYAAQFGVRRVAIKLTSTDTLQLPRLRAALPEATLMLLTRDPVEVAVSHLRIAPAFARLRVQPEVAEAQLGVAVRQRDEQEFSAAVLTRYFEAMLAEERHAAVVMDYASLNAQTIAESIAALIGDVTPAQFARIEARSRINAKQPKRGAFASDSEAKRAAATPELRAMLSEAANLHRQLLTRQRCGQVVRA